MSGTMNPVKRYATTLNNLKQKKLVDYETIEIREGAHHQESWTVTVLLKFAHKVESDGRRTVLTPKSLGYTATANAKREALTIACYYALQDLGYV
ncbi:hypothetical protein FRB94_003199 [Tulasnella sp. JGI-2019a]|nr:hypothetical protein FRB93_004165 [Tulasnella sp. JGI-2019a]KAG9003315.1 hypothetical protein FRB94_003199 [Tulasnella sp. JGI-2019a]KAG9028900.1 hypothetical protein FRB95_005898 [Tulasnella sp. JGI-2019a]